MADQSNHVTLGCGTLIAIALIVLLFSGGGTDKLRDDVKGLREEIRNLQTDIKNLQRSVDDLKAQRAAPN